MKKALIISFTKLSDEPRVQRQIDTLKYSYHLDIIGFNHPKIEDINYIELQTKKLNRLQRSIQQIKLFLGIYERTYWSGRLVQKSVSLLKDKKYDLIIANDIQTLPLAIKLFETSKIVLDAHEYAPKQYEDNWHWRLFFQKYTYYLCKEYIPKADLVFAVCDNIINEYKKSFDIDAKLITNAPTYQNLQPQLIKNNTRKIKIIHHGLAGKSRNIENMIYMAEYLDERFELYFILLEGNAEYIKKLKSLAKKWNNIYFLEPVQMKDIATYTNQFDIGLFLLKPVNFNYANALPNKFFEFIQARLAIAIGPSVEMQKITTKENLGVVSEDFEPQNLAKQINKLSIEQINKFKIHSHRVSTTYSFEENKRNMLDAINNLF